MDDLNSLAEKLDLLVSERPQFDGRKRMLDASNAMRAILQEIDGAELGSQLVFTAGAFHLGLNVSNGNVISVAASNIPGLAALTSISLMPGQDEDVLALADAICAIGEEAAQTQELFLEACELPDQVADEPGRISPAFIRQNVNSTIPEVGESL